MELNLADSWRLFTLARRRLRSEADYLQFEQWQGLLLLRSLRTKGVVLNGKKVID